MTQRIRTIIVDDEPPAREAVRSLLASDPDIAIISEHADGRSALDAIRTTRPELLLLDIQMPELDGFGVLRQLEPDEVPVVVFTTAYDQHALRAFEVHALDYLLKPFNDGRFHEAIARAKQQVQQARLGALSGQLRTLLAGAAAPGTSASAEPYLQRLVIKSADRATILNVDDVNWIDADGDHVTIHAGRDRHQLRETMKRLEQQLDPARFVRIHRSTLVNVDRVKALQPYFRGEYVVVLQDGTSLKLSRGCKPLLEAALGRSF